MSFVALGRFSECGDFFSK